MIPLPPDEWRHAFSTWLRTGQLPEGRRSEETEHKFNPWHDPDDGRFTFSGTGTYYGRGSPRSGSRPKRSSKPVVDLRPAKERDGKYPGKRGGSTGGGGADGSWEPSDPKTREASSKLLSDTPFSGTAKPAAGPGKPSETFRKERQNGYTFLIDSLGRTRRVSGHLAFSIPIRSRAMQARAGGTDRRPTDDGGHYIAARFAGPTEAFNHFAQDASFNRGTYRLLEDQWAKELRAGKSVTVRIVPYYDEGSTRPREIDVWFAIDGDLNSLKFPNERPEKRRGD